MEIVKYPKFENDDYLIRISGHSLKLGDSAFQILKNINPQDSEYYAKKREAFKSYNTDPKQFQQFVEDRPSLRALSSLEDLNSTIYTVAAERQNGESYDTLIYRIKMHLDIKPDTRRCLLRFSNDLTEYAFSEISKPSDVTCLSFIHYFSRTPKMVFRASDVGNELAIDILTITEFFLKPIYLEDKFEVSIYASTAQNISRWNETMSTLMFLGG